MTLPRRMTDAVLAAETQAAFSCLKQSTARYSSTHPRTCKVQRRYTALVQESLRRYEARKRAIAAAALTPVEYEEAVMRAATELGI